MIRLIVNQFLSEPLLSGVGIPIDLLHIANNILNVSW